MRPNIRKLYVLNLLTGIFFMILVIFDVPAKMTVDRGGDSMSYAKSH